MNLVVLIVGGYGTFGGRLVELLEDEPGLTLVVAGRSLEQATAYCHGRVNAKATLRAASFDRSADLAPYFAAFAPAIVVDASGPFQAYGENRYRLIEACIAHRAHYLDLADGTDFVSGVGAYDTQARDAEVFVLSGVSSFPVLSAAVVRQLASGMKTVKSIRGGIAPSPYAGVGENVIRAIAGYAGRPVPMRRNGVPASGYPFTESIRYTIAPPGKLPLRSTLFSLVDVPDLRVLGELWPAVRTVWMGAGPVPEVLHRALIGFSWLVRLGVLRSLSPLSRLMHQVTRWLRWGEHRGGMFVEVAGDDDDGVEVTREWHLLAEGDDGPLIPSMAIEALVRKTLAGSPPAAGARPAVRELELADYDALFSGRTLDTGLRERRPHDTQPLYAQLLGSAWQQLPQPIRTLHSVNSHAVFEGRAAVDRGSGLMANLAALMFGFPKAGPEVPLSVRFDVAGGAEKWTRSFAGHTFSSLQFAGRGRCERLLCERFGPVTFAMALVTQGAQLHLVLRRWAVIGIPLPLKWGPRSIAFEAADQQRFCFHVEISHPWIGLIVRYRGWLLEARPP